MGSFRNSCKNQKVFTSGKLHLAPVVPFIQVKSIRTACVVCRSASKRGGEVIFSGEIRTIVGLLHAKKVAMAQCLPPIYAAKPVISTFTGPTFKFQMTDLSIQYLSSVCRYLHVLNFSGCIRITDKGIAFLRKKCKQLRILSLLYCRNVTK